MNCMTRSTVLSPRTASSALEDQLPSEREHAGTAQSSWDLIHTRHRAEIVEGRFGHGAGVMPNRRIWKVGGTGVIEDIKRLRPELKLHPFPDGKVLEQGNVLVGESRPSQLVSRQVAKVILAGTDVRRQRIRRRVDAGSHVVMDVVFQAAIGVRRMDKIRPLGALGKSGAVV